MTTVKVLGTTDQIGTCDCCERTNLKKTGKIDLGNGPVFYGTGCAARAMKVDAKEISKQARAADAETRRAAKQAIREANMAAFWMKRAAMAEKQKRSIALARHIGEA